MTLEAYLAYAAACLAITLVPGPTVTLIIANGLTRGTRAGLLNVLGTQIGLALMIAVMAVGLSVVMAGLAAWFDWLRLLGAAYLIWLGIKLIRHPPGLSTGTAPPPPRGGFVLQGFLVILSNPKALLFFGAFIPQFIDPATATSGQVILLGGTFMLLAAITDGAYAVLTGSARSFMTDARVRWVGRIGGGVLITGGVWLALTRVK